MKTKLFAVGKSTFFLLFLPMLLLCTWEISAIYLHKYDIFPRATVVFGLLMHPFTDYLQTGSLATNLMISLLRVACGFSLAAIFGVVSGIIIGATPLLKKLCNSTIELLRPLCPISWAPFAITVFGVTSLPAIVGVEYTGTVLDNVRFGIVFILFWGGFFPVLINTMDGVQGVRQHYLRLLKSMGATRTQILLKVYLPGALPSILSGLKQGLSHCWFVIIAAEMLPGTSQGMGDFLMTANDLFRMDLVLVSIIIIGFVGALLNLLIDGIMKRFIHWEGKI